MNEREREREKEQAAPVSYGADAVANHYNAVPQRGREWRSTESAIKNLRSYNNWVKSTLIQKFSRTEESEPGQKLKVLDIGCGKGGDLQKWHNAPQPVELYVGVDPAAVSISQAEGRYHEMRRKNRRHGMFHGEFKVKDCYGEWLGEIPIIREVGISEEVPSRWQEGGFDVVSMMFCLHYAFESESKARMMLRNVAGALKKGGRLIGVIPNSDFLRKRLETFKDKVSDKTGKISSQETPTASNEEAVGAGADGQVAKPSTEDATSKESMQGNEKDTEPAAVVPEWGNSIYRVRFPANTPLDGKFKPPFGWKYSYFLEEAVEELPEFVVPWEAFRALAEDVNLELEYRRPFLDVWDEEKNDRDLGPLSVRMKVTDAVGGDLRLSPDEMEASSLYHAFCFYKV